MSLILSKLISNDSNEYECGNFVYKLYEPDAILKLIELMSLKTTSLNALKDILLALRTMCIEFDMTTTTNNYNYTAFNNDIIEELMYLVSRYDEYLKSIVYDDIFINATNLSATLCTDPLAMNVKYSIDILKLLNIIMSKYSWVYCSLTNNNINTQIFTNYKQCIEIYDEKQKRLLITEYVRRYECIIFDEEIIKLRSMMFEMNAYNMKDYSNPLDRIISKIHDPYESIRICALKTDENKIKNGGEYLLSFNTFDELKGV